MIQKGIKTKNTLESYDSPISGRMYGMLFHMKPIKEREQEIKMDHAPSSGLKDQEDYGNMEPQKKKQTGNLTTVEQHQKDLQRLHDLRPMDDDFMRCLFKDNIPLI